MTAELLHRSFPRRAGVLLTLALAAALVGCSSTHTESYSIELHNASGEPITVWLTKTGDHTQQTDWLAPEDLSTTRAASVNKINGVVIPPDKTGMVGPVTGEFAWEDLAMLRVYAGKLTFDQILATPADGNLRLDVPLEEGVNKLTVHGPKLSVERGGATATTKP